MAIFVIGDLHLSLGADKPMDKFPGWQGYVQRIRENWLRLVAPGDTVVLAGDTSWGMKLEEAAPDFEFLEQLPGQKLLLKGNHDYWWTTARKMETFFEAQGFASLHRCTPTPIMWRGLPAAAPAAGFSSRTSPTTKR